MIKERNLKRKIFWNEEDLIAHEFHKKASDFKSQLPKKDLSVKSGGNAEMQKKTLKSHTFKTHIATRRHFYVAKSINEVPWIPFPN